MKFRPLHDRVVVKRIDAEEKSKGGIIIPDTAKEKPSQGQVVAVGPGGRDESGKVITQRNAASILADPHIAQMYFGGTVSGVATEVTPDVPVVGPSV